MWGHVTKTQCKALRATTNRPDNCVQCLCKRHDLIPQFETIQSDGTKNKKKEKEKKESV